MALFTKLMNVSKKRDKYTKVVSVFKRDPVYESGECFQKCPVYETGECFQKWLCLRMWCQFSKGTLFTKPMNVSKKRDKYTKAMNVSKKAPSLQKVHCIPKAVHLS